MTKEQCFLDTAAQFTYETTAMVRTFTHGSPELMPDKLPAWRQAVGTDVAHLRSNWQLMATKKERVSFL